MKQIYVTATVALLMAVLVSCKTEVTNVQLNKSELTLSIGETETLIATVLPEKASNKAVSWKSSDNNVATVDNNGKITSKESGVALITAITKDGGKTATCTVAVTAAGPLAKFEVNPQMANLGEEIQFVDKSIQGDGKIIKWYWNFGDLKDDYLQNPTHVYSTLGYFTVSLKIEDEFGYQDSIEHEILVVGRLNFPHLFTPIGDGNKRYVFRPYENAGYFEEFQMDVYDRWGILVWNQKCEYNSSCLDCCPNYNNDDFWWDGTNKEGNLVSDGVYFWVVNAIYPTGIDKWLNYGY